MSDKPTKQYGPVEWPQAVREQACKVAADNNDASVTEDVVRGWVGNLEAHAPAFRESHLRILGSLGLEA